MADMVIVKWGNKKAQRAFLDAWREKGEGRWGELTPQAEQYAFTSDSDKARARLAVRWALGRDGNLDLQLIDQAEGPEVTDIFVVFDPSASGRKEQDRFIQAYNKGSARRDYAWAEIDVPDDGFRFPAGRGSNLREQIVYVETLLSELGLSSATVNEYAFDGRFLRSYRPAEERPGAPLRVEVEQTVEAAVPQVQPALLWPSKETQYIRVYFASNEQRLAYVAAWEALEYKSYAPPDTLRWDGSQSFLITRHMADALHAAIYVPHLRVVELKEIDPDRQVDDREADYVPYEVARLPAGSDPRHLDYPLKISEKERRAFLKDYLLPNGDLRPPRWAGDITYYADSPEAMRQFETKVALTTAILTTAISISSYHAQYIEVAQGSRDETLREVAATLPHIHRVEYRDVLELTAPEEARVREKKEERAPSQREEKEYSYAATLLNPKTNELITVWADRNVHRFEISIAGDQESFGSSYLDEDEEAEDGSPRIHTPSGVNKKGGGYGLMLYCGTAVAVAVKKRKPGVHSTREGDCANRSGSAGKIWDKMVDSDLAYTGSGTCAGGGREDTIDDFCVPIPDRMRDVDDGYVTSSEVCGTVDVERSSDNAEMDILPAEKVIEQRLVVHVADAELKNAAAQKVYGEGHRPPIAKLATAKISEDVKDPDVIWTFGLMIRDAIRTGAPLELANDESVSDGTDLQALAEEKANAALVAFLTQPDHIKYLRSSPFLLELLGQQTLFGPSPAPEGQPRRFERFGKIKSIDDTLAAELHEAALEQLNQRAGADWAAGFDAFDADADPVE